MTQKDGAPECAVLESENLKKRGYGQGCRNPSKPT